MTNRTNMPIGLTLGLALPTSSTMLHEERSLDLESEIIDALEALGFDVVFLDVEEITLQ